MTRNRTAAFDSLLNEITPVEWRVIAKMLTELPPESLMWRVLMGAWAEHHTDLNYQAEVLAAFEADHQADLERDYFADLPPATGVRLFFDPETGECRVEE